MQKFQLSICNTLDSIEVFEPVSDDIQPGDMKTHWLEFLHIYIYIIYVIAKIKRLNFPLSINKERLCPNHHQSKQGVEINQIEQLEEVILNHAETSTLCVKNGYIQLANYIPDEAFPSLHVRACTESYLRV